MILVSHEQNESTVRLHPGEVPDFFPDALGLGSMPNGTVTPGISSIRHGNYGDIDQLNSLVHCCIEAMRAIGIDQWDDVYPTRSDHVHDIQSGTLYVVTAANQTIVGSLVLNDKPEPEYSLVKWTIQKSRVAVVHRLMVHPSYQRHGIARQLMQFAENRASELDFGAIRLDAFIANPAALRLYASLGYQVAGTVMFRKGPFHCFEKGL
jgi:ribosomal protein S18 acetylase RimI-like enzyme